VNGKRVAKAVCLSDGDVITLGPVSYRYDSTLNTSLGIIPEGDEIVETLKVVQSINAILLVSDIKGYSTLAEKIEAEELAPVMGKWYALCERIFGEAGGSIQDFAGDSVFAYWPEANFATCEKAIGAARELLSASKEVGRGLAAGNLGLECGVAVHVGQVASGQRLVGDAVNLTFRVEGLSRQVDRDLLVTRAFVESAGGGLAKSKFEPLGEFQVKGREGATEVFSVPDE
jgi:adenylate cyclase